MLGEYTQRPTNASERQMHAGFAVVLAGLLFTAVSAARLSVPDGQEPITSLYVLPIAFVAVRFGHRAGVLVALLAVALSGLSRQIAGIEVSPITVGVLAGVFVPLGFLLGRSSESTRRALERVRSLAAVAESSSDAVYATLADGTVVSWNPAAERLFGYTRSEIVGFHISVIALPDEVDEQTRLHHAVAVGSGPQTIEVQRRAKDGRVLDIELTLSPLVGPDGVTRGTASIAREIGERQRMQAAIADSERRLEQAQAVAGLGSWDWDVETGELIWSRELWSILGLDPEDGPATFERFLDTLHPDDLPRVTRCVEHSLGSGEDLEYTARIVTPEGQVKVIDARAETETGADGRARRLVGTVLDVTARVEAEDKLHLLVERIPTVLYTAETGVDGRWTWVSPQIEKLLGYPADEWLAKPGLWYERIHPGDRERVLPQEGSDDGDRMSAEYRMLARDGRVVWVRDESVIVAARQGERPVMEGVLSDITDRKLAEDAVRASEHRYRTIVETTREGIWMVDEEGRTTFANRKLAELLGETVESIQGRRIWDFLSPDAREYVELHRDRARTESGVHGEIELRTSDGFPVWAQVSTSPIVEDGVYRGQLALVTDVSGDRVAAEERRQLEARLHQHERMESVGQLAGGIAHDFNNLLAVILTYANFASAELEDSPLKEDIDEIQRAAERAAALTRQLLVFSRREMTQPEVCDLNEIVAETESMLKRTLGENLILQVNCQEDLWPLKADRGQLEQVLLNLAINARDAMHRGGRLTIETSNVHLDEAFAEVRGDAEPGPYVRLAVTDTGEGMPPGVAERVFEPFFTTKPKGQGTGLGLATVYGIVQQAKGHIDIYSEQGVGTVFKVYFPVSHDVETREAAVPTAGGSLEGNGEKVLVVEDEDAVRRVVKRVLSKAGYTVLEAADPRHGLALFEELHGQVDLLLTDVVMPGMSGTELVERMRATHPELRVLMSSGYTDDVVMRDGIAEHRVAFIEKPFSPDGLLRKVREVLDAPVPVPAGARE